MTSREPESIPASPGASAREILFFAIGLVGLVALMIMLSDGTLLLTRPFWVDEVFAVMVASQSSPLGVITDLSRGADGGAGLLHLALWALWAITGFLTPPLLRAMSLTFVIAAICLVYVVLRRRFGRDASVAGALAVGSHGLVVHHAFEARFYGPWLFCCALFAWSLGRNQQPSASRRAKLIVAFAAILVCTIHFYGVLTLFLMSGAVVASYGRQWRNGLRIVVPAVAGLVAVVAIVPIAIGIRGAFSVPSWIPDLELAQFVALARRFWIAEVPLIAAIALAIGLVVRRTRGAVGSVGRVARHASTDAGIVALTALALVPVALLFVSITVQPAMLPRYATTAALAWGPWVALVVEQLGRWPALVARVVLVWFWFVSFTRKTYDESFFSGLMNETDAAIRGVDSVGVPVIYQSIHVLYPLVKDGRGQPSSAALLELSDSTFARIFPLGTNVERLNRGLVLDRDIARIHARRFRFPRLASEAALDSTPRFILVGPAHHLPVGYKDIVQFGQSVFPQHRVRRLHLHLALIERAEPAQ